MYNTHKLVSLSAMFTEQVGLVTIIITLFIELLNKTKLQNKTSLWAYWPTVSTFMNF